VIGNKYSGMDDFGRRHQIQLFVAVVIPEKRKQEVYKKPGAKGQYKCH
jgi:hypothetical protein